jgi:hypothetical protein
MAQVKLGYSMGREWKRTLSQRMQVVAYLLPLPCATRGL